MVSLQQIKTNVLRLRDGMEELWENKTQSDIRGFQFFGYCEYSRDFCYSWQSRGCSHMRTRSCQSGIEVQIQTDKTSAPPSCRNVKRCEYFLQPWHERSPNQGWGEQAAPGWRTTDGHNKNWAGRKREWGFGRVGHFEGGKRCDLREKGQTMRGKKLDLFRWKIKVKEKADQKLLW